MAKTIYELAGSAFYHSEDPFDGVPISVFFLLQSKSVPMERRPKSGRRVAEKDHIVDRMFLADSERNISVSACVFVRSSRMWSRQFVLALTSAYSQYRSSSS